MIELATGTCHEDEMPRALTVDCGVGSPIDAIQKCSEAIDVGIRITPESEDNSPEAFRVAEMIVAFVVERSRGDFQVH
jgi:hypothetical protein